MISALLIEDDPRVSAFLQRGLMAEGYAVDCAGDGQSGLDQALTETYDVLIVDVMLPGLSGRELLSRLRVAGVTTPALILTAMDATPDKIEGLRSGADDYLTKPFDFDELLARLQAMLRRASWTPAASVAARLVVGDITIDRTAMTVTSAGALIEMTATEFQLLDFLMSAPGRVQSRTRILNKVWGLGADPLTNVVDVYVRRLRQKLNMDPDNGPIKTVRGFGYRFDAPHD